MTVTKRLKTAHLMVIVVMLLGSWTAISCGGQTNPGLGPDDSREMVEGTDEKPRGLLVNSSDATSGYVYFAPLLSKITYLVESQSGAVVRTWNSEFRPSAFVYLLENGNLLRGGREPDVEVFSGGGQGGRLQEFTWDGDLVWDFRYATDSRLLHHDVAVMPNGNILAVAWEAKSLEETQKMGRTPEMTPENGLWPDIIVEFEPVPPNDARIVWEWHAWDHMVQDYDQNLENYGELSVHPELIDVNGGTYADEPDEITDEERDRFRGIGYVPDDSEHDVTADLMHINAIAYNAELDQIALSVRTYSEIWIIDHSTTTEEARGHTGGRSGKGGDLLYRWGNPRAYGRGDAEDQRTFGQHDIRWVPEGFVGERNLLVFSNNVPGPEGEGPHSTVFEITPPLDNAGNYALEGLAPFGPTVPTWSYTATEPESFHSPFISGAHRLPSGHTFITSGGPGRFFEVTRDGDIVWDYRSQFSGDVDPSDDTMQFLVRQFPYAAFRATMLLPDAAALRGRSLVPLEPQPPLVFPPEVIESGEDC